MVIDTTGHVGIGTATPDSSNGWNKVLEVQGGPHAKSLVTTTTNGVKMGSFAHSNWGGPSGSVGTESNHDLRLLTNYNEKMIIKKNGNVGIGTSNPSEKLHINGKLKVDNNIHTDGVVLSKNTVQNIQGVSNGILVHERIIWGTAGHAPKSYGTTDTLLCHVYNPFGYAVPTKNTNTTRKYRLYAIYSDGMTTSGEHTITFNIGSWGSSSKKVSFKLPRTWGTTSASQTTWNRDSYSSNWITESDVNGGHHGKVYVRVNGSGTQTGVLRYLVLQSWDFPN
jgi:hypothetical protein